MILDIAIIIFVLLEFSNIVILYFKPDCKYGNGMDHFQGGVIQKKMRVVICLQLIWLGG